MGLDGTATRIIFIVATLGVTASLIDLGFEHATLDQRSFAPDDPAVSRALTRLDEARLCYDASQQIANITVRNMGDDDLELDEATALLDGVPVSATAVVDSTQDHVLWSVGETARWSVSSPGAPTRALVVTKEGAKVSMRASDCPTLTSIVVTPSSWTMNTSQQKAFSAQGFDQFGLPMSGITFSWSATTGSITAGGVYTSPSTAGSATITAQNGAVQGTSSVTIVKKMHVSAMATYDTSDVAQSTFAKGTTVRTRVTIVDHNAVALAGATVNIEIRDPNNVLKSNSTGVTDGSGIATIDYTQPSANNPGQWSIRTTLVTLAGASYDPGANAVTTISFTQG